MYLLSYKDTLLNKLIQLPSLAVDDIVIMEAVFHHTSNGESIKIPEISVLG